jgi:hypothetical protein
MPFWDGARFHLFYLLDYDHHRSFGGKGGHQWAHISTEDLIRWEEHPLALSLRDMEGVSSICTGSVFKHDECYYAFFSTRDFTGPRETPRLAKSSDCVNFTWDTTTRLPRPEDCPELNYNPGHFRDPVVFSDEQTGVFHMLVSSSLMPSEEIFSPYDGCLAHMESTDLKDWKLLDPLLIPGYEGVPECSDWFRMDGWYYLLFSHGAVTYYRMSKNPLGPWIKPVQDALTSPYERVMKTASFGNRRLGVAYLPTVENGKTLYAGRAVFREIIQFPDGTLGTKFPEELLPEYGMEMPGIGDVEVDGRSGFRAVPLRGEFSDCRIKLRIIPEGNGEEYGMLVKGVDYLDGRELVFCPRENRVEFRNPAKSWRSVESVVNHIRVEDDLDEAVHVDIMLDGDTADVCVNGKQCMICSFPEAVGDRVFLFARNSKVRFCEIRRTTEKDRVLPEMKLKEELLSVISSC